jgi:hypothetical protein
MPVGPALRRLRQDFKFDLSLYITRQYLKTNEKNGTKYLQIIHLIRYIYLEYIKHSDNSTIKNIQLKMSKRSGLIFLQRYINSQ